MKTTAEKTKLKTLNLGFVGLGWIGLNRMKRVLSNPNIKGTAIVEPLKENADQALKISENAKVYESYEELLENPEIDGVMIATPSALHAKQVKQALKAKKAVFCQKPLGRNSTEVKQVIQTAYENNQLLGVDLSYRFTKAFQQVYKIIKSGEIGKVFSAELKFHNAYGPDKEWFYDIKKSGGGCVLDLGLHLIDLGLWCLDFSTIENLQSHLFYQGKKIKKNEKITEDFASISFLTSTNTSINLQCSWNISAGKDAVISVHFYGTKGGVAFKNVAGSFYDFVAEKYTGTNTEILISPPDYWSGKAAEVWAEKLLNGEKFNAVNAKEHLRLAEIIDKIYEREI